MVYAAMLQQLLALIRALYVIVIHHIFGRQPLSSDFIQPSTSVTTVTEDLSYRIIATWGGEGEGQDYHAFYGLYGLMAPSLPVCKYLDV